MKEGFAEYYLQMLAVSIVISLVWGMVLGQKTCLEKARNLSGEMVCWHHEGDPRCDHWVLVNAEWECK